METSSYLPAKVIEMHGWLQKNSDVKGQNILRTAKKENNYLCPHGKQHIKETLSNILEKLINSGFFLSRVQHDAFFPFEMSCTPRHKQTVFSNDSIFFIISELTLSALER